MEKLTYICTFLFLASLPNKLVYKEQHRSWCTLGFIRSIALMPQMCSTLSTSQWITLLMKIVEGHESFTAASLQRQVMCAFQNYFALSLKNENKMKTKPTRWEMCLCVLVLCHLCFLPLCGFSTLNIAEVLDSLKM